MIVFSTIINGFKDYSSLTGNQSGGLFIMTFVVLFFITLSIYGLIKSCKEDYYKSVLPSLLLVLLGFFIFDTIGEVNMTLFNLAEIGGIVLLSIPATIYFYHKVKKDKKGVKEE